MKSTVGHGTIVYEVLNDDGEAIVSYTAPGWIAICGNCKREFVDEISEIAMGSLEIHWTIEHKPYTCKTL